MEEGGGGGGGCFRLPQLLRVPGREFEVRARYSEVAVVSKGLSEYRLPKEKPCSLSTQNAGLRSNRGTGRPLISSTLGTNAETLHARTAASGFLGWTYSLVLLALPTITCRSSLCRLSGKRKRRMVITNYISLLLYT